MSKFVNNRYVAVPREFFDQSERFNASEFRLIVVMLAHTGSRKDDPGGWWTCYPSHESMAIETDTNVNTVRRNIRNLKPKGLKVTRRGVVFDPSTGLYRAPTNVYDLSGIVNSLRAPLTEFQKAEKKLVKDFRADQRYEYFRKKNKQQQDIEPENDEITDPNDLDFNS